MSRVYLDHAATSPATPEARAAEREAETLLNASSLHLEGQRARARLDAARAEVADAVGVGDDEVHFTSGGTESANLALRGTCWARGRGAHLVVSALEHEAVLRTARWLEEHGDVRLTVVRATPEGLVRADDVAAALTADTVLVSLMMVNNEVGTVQPIREVVDACRERSVRVHVDAVQALGRMDVRRSAVDADLVTLSAHKVGGPKGCGVLVARKGVSLAPAMTGGRQESGLRAGTEPVAAIAGGARAIALAAASWPERAARLAHLTSTLERGLLAIPGAALNGAAHGRAPGITNVSFDGAPSELLLPALDVAGFAVSNGSACSSGSPLPSHVLEAMGLPEQRSRAAIRLSLGPTSTGDELDRLLRALPPVLERVRREAGG